MTHFAVKRLAAVEIQPDTSNQHELNAGALRTGLGFPEGRTEGVLSILYYLVPDADPQVLEGTFTLYDSRANHPTRSEYRLYYRLPGLVEIARPDDLMVLCRDSESGGLQGVIARQGTPMERHLEQLLGAGDHASLRRLVVRAPGESRTSDAAELVQTLLPVSSATDIGKAARAHRLFSSAVAKEAVPSTKQMALAGKEISEVVWGARLDPDDFISRGLDAESELYFTIEREVGTRSLHDLLKAGPASLEEMLAWALRIQQSRKARRGQSLQNHFGFLLDREGIPYTSQCVTERGETPDFVIPGHTKYHDPDFPAERLRMVACKSTVRERWGQVLKEADRIREKYLLSVDENLSADVIISMRQADLRVFLPTSTLDGSYPTNSSKHLLGNIGQLVECLALVL
ncbi:MAG: type II restriction endonuclease [Gemmatimonadota bacterium]|nr:type II restriction endonuclease [Gemmatimonadota bacterium]